MKKISILFAGLLFLLSCVTVSADTVPKLENKKGSLTIEVSSEEDNKTVVIGGVKLSVTKVASLEVDGSKSSYYTLDPEYAETKVEFEGMTASKSNEIAKKLAEFQDQKSLSGSVRTTNSKGRAAFSRLEHGMYLVRQVGKSGTAAKYTDIEPFLVSVPEYNKTSGAWNYQVLAYPKTVPSKLVTPPPSTPPSNPPNRTPPVNTGDATRMSVLIGVFGVSLVCLIALLFIRNRKR